MNPQRFDRFTRAFGTRLSRRTALSAGAALAGLTVTGPRSPGPGGDPEPGRSKAGLVAAAALCQCHPVPGIRMAPS